MFKFSRRSIKSLEKVEPDLIKVMTRAICITPIDFGIIQGLRTLEEQKRNLANGASTTMHSRHLPNKEGYACAVDIVVWNKGEITWDSDFYIDLSYIIKSAADDVNVQIEWGGDWKTFKDYGHYQLPWSLYP